MARSHAAAQLARHAIASLYDELALYPKPGLVSLRDSGAHADMNAGTFMRSLFALRGYFKAVAEAGARMAPFDQLRQLGVEAERRMIAATGGVNTHRGAIFSVGLLCAAAASVRAAGVPPSDIALRRALTQWLPALRSSHARFPAVLAHGELVSHRVGAAAAGGEALPSHRELVCLRAGAAGAAGEALVSHGELASLRFGAAGAAGEALLSHGELASLRFGAAGARGEALASFPSVFELALPALRSALEQGAETDAARVHAFFTLLAVVEDTNLLYRGGRAGLSLLRDEARAFLARGSVFRRGCMEDAERLHRRCCELGLSPGGCADLLSASCFVHRLQTL